MDKKSKQPNSILTSGAKAPDFRLHSTDQSLSAGVCVLSSFRGSIVILVFYPYDWSPVCGEEVALFNESLPILKDEGAEQVFGISVDSIWCHRAFARARNLHFELLSDFEPKGEVAQSYGAYNYDEGRASRALFIINTDGTIAWSYLSPDEVNPGVDGVLKVLENLGKGEGRLAR